VYTSGVWVVKEGHEDEFRRLWQAGADQGSLQVSGITFRLLHDRENPLRFVSIAGPWRNAEQIESARALPGYREAMAGIDEIAESSELSTYELAAEVS
jgi:quinol monooxygenase YgiN